MCGGVSAGTILCTFCTVWTGAMTGGWAPGPTSPLRFEHAVTGGARVAGRLDTSDGRQLTSGAVVIVAAAAGEGQPAPPVQDVTILPDGSFVFLDVPPGEYVIRARGDVDSRGVTQYASFRIRVEGADVDGIHLRLEPGAIVQGRVVVERRQGAPVPSWDGVRVSAPFADGTSFGDRLDGQVRRDGTFRIRGLMSGAHLLSVEGLPAPWAVKRVTSGGRDITISGLVAESNRRYSDLRITITDAPAPAARIASGGGFQRRH